METAQKPQIYNWPKIIITLLLCSYALYYTSTSTSWHFIDNVDLIFHEAGHTIFSFFGQFIAIAAGSAFQILVPMVCSIYFFFQKQFYSASLLLYWVGINFINVSVYAGDALKMQLPLLGGDGVIHDWNYLLSNLGLLSHTHFIAQVLFGTGVTVFIAAALISIKVNIKE